MEDFSKSLFEIYMNYDTLQYLKEDNESNENIISMFKEELDYSKDLTSTLLKYEKTFFKSIAMRIKLKMKRELDNEKIKGELLSYDPSLSPLLEKLLKSSDFKNQYDNINEENTDVEVVEEEADSYGNDDSNNEDNLEGLTEYDKDDENDKEEEEEEDLIQVFLNKLNNTGNSDDTIKISDLYKAYCEFSDEEDYEKVNKTDFKEYMTDKWGKCPKNGYEGYKL
tara:strand:+ start:30 stop:701 length:672 start_codon:yes stop_codon:yes gene_type:complete